MPDLSIIIVTYNPGKTIVACLEALYRQSDGLSLEVIVVDNASHDGTPELVQSTFPHVKLITSQDNLGYGLGNNRGFEFTTSEFVVILNPDVVVLDGALKSMIEYLKAHKLVGFVGPKTFDAEHQLVVTARSAYTVPRLLARYTGIGSLFPLFIYGRHGQLSITTSVPLEVDWVQGSVLGFRREVYAALNGFDDGFFLFLEDVDLCLRAHVAGWKVVYLPTATVEHIGSESVSRFHAARIRSYQISPLYYYRKRGRENSVRILKIGFVAALMLKSVSRRLINVVRPSERRREQAQVEWSVIQEVWRY